MRPRVITAPAAEPVTVAEAQSHLRQTIPDDDADIAAFIQAARDYIENRCGRTIHQTTYELAFRRFPTRICLLRGTPVISVDSIKYRDSDGVQTTLDPSLYEVSTYAEPGYVVPAHGESWPSFDPHPVDAVIVRYTAGIATSSPFTEAPAGLKNATLLLVGALYANREGELTDPGMVRSVALQYGIDALLIPYIADYGF